MCCNFNDKIEFFKLLISCSSTYLTRCALGVYLLQKHGLQDVYASVLFCIVKQMLKVVDPSYLIRRIYAIIGIFGSRCIFTRCTQVHESE